MLEIKKKEDIMIITLVIVIIITLINCITNMELIDMIYLFLMCFYFVKVMKIRLKD